MKRTKLAFGMLVAPMHAVGVVTAGPSSAVAAEGADLAADAGTALQTQAYKEYGVWVGGVKVTSKNAKNVLGDGHVSYNAKKKTLTLKNSKDLQLVRHGGQGRTAGTDRHPGLAERIHLLRAHARLQGKMGFVVRHEERVHLGFRRINPTNRCPAPFNPPALRNHKKGCPQLVRS